MNKLLSIIITAGMLLTVSTVMAEDGEREYTSEGGYIYEYDFGTKFYHSADDSTYRYYLNADEGYVALTLRGTKYPDITVPATVNGVPVKAVSSDKVGKERLESIAFPDTVTTIDSFADYVNLKSVTLPKDLTEIKRYSFDGCISLDNIVIPDSVTKIGEHAFSNCTALKNVKLNEGLLAIDQNAFSKTGIERIELPSTLVRLNKGCFKDTKALKSVTIPENIKRIEERAFFRSGIESLTLKCRAEYIGDKAFYETPLKEVNGLSRDDMISFWNAFSYTPWQKSMVNEDEPFLVDKNGRLVAYVGSSADIVIPDTVKTIGSSAFTGKVITSVSIPNSVTEIEELAFYGCEQLKAVNIPASVEKIGQMAFSNCYRLKNITFEYSATALSLGSSAFQFTLASPETLITNNRRYSNQKTAFQNTYFDPDYAPMMENGKYVDESYTEPPTATPKPTATPDATAETEAPAATAAPSEAPEDINVRGGETITVSLGDKEITFIDARPYIDENGRTQIPVRAVAEALGCKVDWDEATETATITRGDRTVYITIGKDILQVNNEMIIMDTTAEIQNDRTYIPLRFVGEALGMTVNWKG